MEDVERKIKNIYNSKKLSFEQLETIHREDGMEREKQFSISSLLKYAAVLVFFLGSFYVFYFYPLQQKNQILDEFIEEIAFNHEKKLPPEIQTNNVSKLNEELSKLNFEITLPKRITNTLKLIGGRYCSIDNRIAAQLKLKNQNSEIVTCYIFKKEEPFDVVTEKIKNNVEVTLWDSDTLIYAIATENK